VEAEEADGVEEAVLEVEASAEEEADLEVEALQAGGNGAVKNDYYKNNT
jgi:hypothetical protein